MMFKVVRYSILLYLALVTLMGCQLVTVEVHQTAITDKGDNTNDKYLDDGKEIKGQRDTIKVPLVVD